MTTVRVISNILEANDRIARQNAELFSKTGVYVVNLMSSPGAGKTTLLERTVETLASELRIGVIEGDIQSSVDAERIGKHGIQAVQINTGGACHLDGNMIRDALEEFDLPKKYPLMFQESSALVVTKIDLLPHVSCSVDTIELRARALHADIDIFRVSCTTGEGLGDWFGWLNKRVADKRSRVR
ncbi:MAG: hydrogenase nickel incorporation protein HypB [Polyangiaceae bacterium]|nr:hydrogenase nickel incorporation protein HypB [Polyangiaceae bacterium]